MRFLKNTFKFLVLLIAVILIALPYAAKQGAMHFLKTEMNMQSNIDDISINLFSGKIGLKGVHLYGEEIGELHLGKFSIDIGLTKLFQKNILIESIEFHDFRTNVTELDKAWNVGGIHIPLSEEESKEPEKPETESKPFEWGYGVRSIAFSNIKIDVTSQYTDSYFILSKLKVKDALSWYPANNSEIELDLNINGDTFRISGGASPFLENPVLKSQVTINDIQLKPFLKSVKDLPFDDASVAIYSDFELAVAMEKDQILLGLNGNYGLKDIYLKDKDREIKLGKLGWDGKHDIVLPTSGKKLVNLVGVLALENIDVSDNANNAHITESLIALDGEYNIKLDDKSETPEIAVATALALKQLTVNTIDGKTKIASFDNWDVKNIAVNGLENVAIGNSELNNLVLLKGTSKKEDAAVVTLKKFIINEIQYQPEQVKIAKVELQKLNADVVLDENGNIPALEAALPKSKTEEPDTKTDEKKTTDVEKPTDSKSKEEKPFYIVLDEILINSDSNVHFVDNSVTPVFDTKLHGLKLSVLDVDSKNTKKSTKIDLGVKIDEYAQFALKGNVNPFSEKVSADMIADLDALELVPLSSYAGKFAGINIKRGTLDLDVDIDIKNDILDIKNTFYMNQLTVESDESEVKDNIFKDMPMPLDLTLDVLRDKNNIIKLDIPVKGNINEPDFRLQDVYNTAMAKAMKFAATHYLMQAVQPLGLVITAGKLIGKAAAPKFDPLIFNEGSFKISKTNKGHIEKLANILKDKDKLRFTICGNATESDWKVIKIKQKVSEKKPSEKVDQTKDSKGAKKSDPRTKILLKLANDRTKLVKKEFVEVHNIEPKRLFACNGKITKDEEDKPAIPSVEITL